MTSRVIRHQRSRSDCGLADLYHDSNLPIHDIDAKNLFHLNGAYNSPINNPDLHFNDLAATSANTPSKEFIGHLLEVLFTGLPPPDPLILKALTHDPPYFLSRLPNSVSAVGFDPLGLSYDERNNPRSRRISTTVMRIFSPMRKKSRRLRKMSAQQTRTRIFRPSTTSLPAQIMQMTVDPGARDEHWWSMLQLAMDSTNPRPAPSKSDQPPIVPAVISSTSEESKRTKETSDTASGVTETVENTSMASEGVSINQETALAPSQPSPVVQTPSTSTAAIDEAQIAKLKKNAQRLEAAIRNIELRKTGSLVFHEVLTAFENVFLPPSFKSALKNEAAAFA